jgi:hypothetical protein
LRLRIGKKPEKQHLTQSRKKRKEHWDTDSHSPFDTLRTGKHRIIHRRERQERKKITRSKPAQEAQASKRMQRPFEASSSSCPCCRTQPPLLAVLSRGFIPQIPCSPIL